MIILIDNYDSFTFNIYHYLGEIGAKVEVIRNDKKTSEEIISMKPKALIFSPGPCTPNEAGISLDLIVKSKLIFPMLGICLGHQSIGQAFGSDIVQCKEIMHGKVDIVSHENHDLFKDIDNKFEATRYHSLIIEKQSLSNELEIIAECDNMIMGVKHKDKLIYGVQFHPESIKTENGLKIIENFLAL